MKWTTIAVDDLILVGMENVFVVTTQYVPVGNIVNQEDALVRNCVNIMINNKYFDLIPFNFMIACLIF